METVAILVTLFVWIITIGIVMLTPLVSLVLAVGWANLIVSNSHLFNQFRAHQRQIIISCLLYIPILIMTCLLGLQRLNQLGLLETPVASLCVVNLMPYWWLIGAIGILLVGIQTNRPDYIRPIRGLFIIAAVCYALTLVMLLIMVKPADGFDINVTIYLNFFMTCSFIVTVSKPIFIRSWRRLFFFFVLVIALSYVVNLLAVQFPLPTD